VSAICHYHSHLPAGVVRVALPTGELDLLRELAEDEEVPIEQLAADLLVEMLRSQVLHRISAFALTLIACVNGYSEDPPAVVPPVDAGTTPEAAVVPTARVDGAPPPACKLSEPFTTPEVVGGFGEINASFPSLSRDERTIIVAGNYSAGAAAILLAERASATEAFAVAPRVIAPATSLDGPETSATLSADGLELIFANAPPTSFFSRLYRSTRKSRAVEFGPPSR